MNMVVIAGRMAAEPELTNFASGAKLLRILVTVRSDEPRRRVDVIPIVMWEPEDGPADFLDKITDSLSRGQGVRCTGAVQRRFWSAEAGRTSRVEVVAHSIEARGVVDDR